MHRSSAVPDATVAAKARELTANSRSELDRIRAIAQFVQRCNTSQSTSVSVGETVIALTRLAQVLARAYGDCKDKANLMRAMLKSVNITAYPIVIFLGDEPCKKKSGLHHASSTTA